MKIPAIINLNFNINNNRKQAVGMQPCYTDYFGLRLNPGLERDTVSFGAKIPSIVTPTMEDLVNRTKAVDILRFNVLRLAKHGIPCPVCGHIMLDVDKFNEFENKIMETTSPTEILNYIGELKKYLHPVEAKIFSMMREDNTLYPDRTLHKMLKIRLPKSERKIVQYQTKLFSNIGLMSRDLPDEQRVQVQDLLNETFARILDPRETSRFSRRIFINKLKNIFIPEEERAKLKDLFEKEYKTKYPENSGKFNFNDFIEYVNSRMDYEITNWEYTLEQKRIIVEATKLPMAYNNADAFIVKYAKRNYNGANPDQKIALRMLSNSLATVEHIKAQAKRGATEPKNLALECASDNNRRGSEPVIEQIVENPMMPFNYRHYMKRLCELHLNNVVEKSYITQQNRTYRDESYGILNADLSIMNRRNKNRVRNQHSKDSGVTPTKAERRAARKIKMKLKKHKSNN